MFDIFIISPYSHEDSRVRSIRLTEVEDYMSSLLKKGITPYSTISAMDHICSKYNIPFTYNYWERHCKKAMQSCNEVHVLCLPGWDVSIGVADEIKEATMLGKKITYIEV